MPVLGENMYSAVIPPCNPELVISYGFIFGYKVRDIVSHPETCFQLRVSGNCRNELKNCDDKFCCFHYFKNYIVK